MGFGDWLERKLIGDPTERKLRREVDAETKTEYEQAYREQYKISRIEEAKKRGKARAEKAARTGQGGGVIDVLGKLGAISDSMSKGIVKDVEFNPAGANTDLEFTPEEERQRKRRHKKQKYEADPFQWDPHL
jgi:hypothetical protein